MESKDIVKSIVEDLGGGIGLISGARDWILSLAENAVNKAKARIADIENEEQFKEVLGILIQSELVQVVPLEEVESFVNARLPIIIRSIAPFVEGSVFPKVEADGVALLVDYLVGLISKKYGADWFVKLKASI